MADNSLARGGGVSSKQVKLGDNYGSLPTPTRSGKTFVGWHRGKNLINVADRNVTVTSYYEGQNNNVGCDFVLEAGVTYTLSFYYRVNSISDGADFDTSIGCGETSVNGSFTKDIVSGGMIYTDGGEYRLTCAFTPTSEQLSSRPYLYLRLLRSYTADKSINADVYKIQLEYGSTATEYEPYSKNLLDFADRTVTVDNEYYIQYTTDIYLIKGLTYTFSFDYVVNSSTNDGSTYLGEMMCSVGCGVEGNYNRDIYYQHFPWIKGKCVITFYYHEGYAVTNGCESPTRYFAFRPVRFTNPYSANVSISNVQLEYALDKEVANQNSTNENMLQLADGKYSIQSGNLYNEISTNVQVQAGKSYTLSFIRQELNCSASLNYMFISVGAGKQGVYTNRLVNNQFAAILKSESDYIDDDLMFYLTFCPREEDLVDGNYLTIRFPAFVNSVSECYLTIKDFRLKENSLATDFRSYGANIVTSSTQYTTVGDQTLLAIWK